MIARSGHVDLEAALAFTSTQLDADGFQQFTRHLDRTWIEEALLATGTATLRRRRLPAEQVVWLVLGMALLRDRPIVGVVDRLDLALPDGRRPPAPSGVAQARARVGEEPLEWLFVRCADEWAHASADRRRWRGLALYSVDGTTVRIADSDENRECFGGQAEGEKGRGPSGYPLVRLVTLMALRSHLIAAASFGPYLDERAYADDLWDAVPHDSLLIVDRLYFAAKTLLPLTTDGNNRQWMTRARKGSRWVVIEKLGDGDDLVELQVSGEARRQMPTLPKTWRMRAVQYQRKGFEPQVLLTSLVDAKKYPAAELAALYHERWEIEVGYDELKTDLLQRHETIRSKSPTLVRQELWGILLAYNLVRLEIERVADENGIDPRRVSFVTALRLIADEWAWSAISRSPGAIPRHLVDMREKLTRLILPARRDRTFPRAVKVKMSNYALKRKPATRKPR